MYKIKVLSRFLHYTYCKSPGPFQPVKDFFTAPYAHYYFEKEAKIDLCLWFKILASWNFSTLHSSLRMY